jgi:hypothetical protein
MSSEFEIVLPRRVVPQPTPAIVPGGDCGACVLGGLLGISIERVYDDLRGKRDSIHFSEMGRILRAAESTGLASGAIDEPAFWLPFRGDDGVYSFGIQARDCGMAWFRLLRMALQAGYYAIAHVDYDRNVASPRGRETNHWTAIVGARFSWQPNPHMAGTKCGVEEVLVSCSARKSPDEEWVERPTFLRERGGLDLLFVRPAGAP